MSAETNPDTTATHQDVDDIDELVTWQLEKGGGW